MSLLRTREFIDIIELDSFVHANYGWQASSFHRILSEALDYPGQNEMVMVEMLDDEALELEDRDSKYCDVVKVFRKLVEDGHLPERDQYYVEVWW
jgi:hypothetical protein